MQQKRRATGRAVHNRAVSAPERYSSHGSRAEAEFLQRRVAAFGLVAGGLLAAGLAFRLAFGLMGDVEPSLVHPSYLAHLLAAVLFLGLWALGRGAPRSREFVAVVEAVGVIGGCTAFTVVGLYLPASLSPALVVTLALTQLLIARAVYVPSDAPRTLALSVIVAAPLLASVVLPMRDESVAVLLSTGLWWAATTVICTAASRVIYGLRRQVDQAEQLGQYQLEEKLGEGAMGVVYRARHAMLARPTAVKLLLPDRLGERALARFEREVRQTARLTHPHTVTIYDYGRTPDGIFYYAMELLEGASLERIVALDGPQPPERVASIMDQVAAALSEAHSIGLIHRDIKPANIILTEQGGEPDVAKVVDFGLVKDIRGGDEAGLSQTGEIAGTPYYMAPEMILAYQEVDARSDLYGLGAVCYFLLTGETVFKGRTAGEICTHHIHTEPIPPSKRRDTPIPHDLESLVLACLAKDPAKRPQTAGHVRARLWAGGTLGRWNTDRARRWWRAEGEKVKATPVPATDAKGRTIAIDLARHR